MYSVIHVCVIDFPHSISELFAYNTKLSSRKCSFFYTGETFYVTPTLHVVHECRPKGGGGAYFMKLKKCEVKHC